MRSEWQTRTFERLTGESAHLSKDIGEEAAANQPRNSLLYLVANVLGKAADELSSARLILPWLFGVLAIPSFLVAFIVPLREAGVLVPQMWVAAYGKRFSRRQSLWIKGALLSGVTLIGIGCVTLFASGWVAGLLILLLLGLYSLGRGVCSVTAKEVAGKIIAKSLRGRLMGWAGAAAGIAIVALGALLTFRPMHDQPVILASLMVTGGLLWGIACLAFGSIAEPEQPTDEVGGVLDNLKKDLRLLRTDASLRNFIWVRALLISTAVAQPFIVLLIQEAGAASLSSLGWLILVSALASAIASPIWGYFSDLNAPKQLMIAALISSILMLGTAALAWSGALNLGLLALIFAGLTLAHTGVRLARKVYLIDLADQDNRGSYTALSNTLIGVLMLAAGAVGLLGEWFGNAAVLAALGMIAGLAAYSARWLTPVRD